MRPIHLNLSGEEAVFSWRDGKAYCTGYDLESEKAALALTSFGTGIGVLLVASNACCKGEIEFKSEIKKFVAGQEKLILSEPEGQLLFEYYSYSPDPLFRWVGMESARLTERQYKRLLAEKEDRFKMKMASLKELPEKYFYTLLTLSNSWINVELAYNESCPINVLEILAQDKDVRVKRYVARNSNCPRRILEILAQDKDGEVWFVARENLAKSRGLEI